MDLDSRVKAYCLHLILIFLRYNCDTYMWHSSYQSYMKNRLIKCRVHGLCCDCWKLVKISNKRKLTQTEAKCLCSIESDLNEVLYEFRMCMMRQTGFIAADEPWCISLPVLFDINSLDDSYMIDASSVRKRMTYHSLSESDLIRPSRAQLDIVSSPASCRHSLSPKRFLFFNSYSEIRLL